MEEKEHRKNSLLYESLNFYSFFIEENTVKVNKAGYNSRWKRQSTRSEV